MQIMQIILQYILYTNNFMKCLTLYSADIAQDRDSNGQTSAESNTGKIAYILPRNKIMSKKKY